MSDLYSEISEILIKKNPEIQTSQMFGKQCLKINGKAFAALFKNKMVFKLSGEEHEEAMGLKGAKLWETSRKHRPMKEWVQVPESYSDKWLEFAKKAAKYVADK